MYTHHTNGLGEDPVAAPSLWDSFSKLLTTGVSTGFNIYNKVQNLTAQQKAATAAQEQAKQMAQYSAMYAVQQRPAAYGQSQDFLGGWTMPLLIAGAAIVGVVLLRKK